MFHSKTLNNSTNSIHERALRFVYRNKKRYFRGTIRKRQFVIVHHKKPQLLATKIVKVRINPAPDTMKEVFQFKNSTCTYVQTQRPLSHER